jgi:hypothetical protein
MEANASEAQITKRRIRLERQVGLYEPAKRARCSRPHLPPAKPRRCTYGLPRDYTY